MSHATKMPTDKPRSRKPAASPQPARRKARADAIINHVEAAKARKSGTNITALSFDELIADLLLHSLSV